MVRRHELTDERFARLAAHDEALLTIAAFLLRL